MKVMTIILNIINYLCYTRHILEDLLLLIIIFTLLCEIGISYPTLWMRTLDTYVLVISAQWFD